MTDKPQFSLSPIQKEDEDGVMKLIERTFYLDEPLNKAVGLCDGGAKCSELEEYCKHALFEGYSFKVTDKEGNIIGAMVSGVCPLKEEDDGNDLLSQAKRCKNPKFQKILYILARREEYSRLWEKFPNDHKMVEIKVAATDQRWRRRGIMNLLVKETEKVTKDKGIRLLRMDTSSAYSAMSAEKAGFTCYYSAKYTDIKKDGQPLVVPELPHVEDRVNVKELF